MSKITKCPLCGKKLTSRNGVPTCPDCGYHASEVSGASAVNLNETGTVSGNSNKNKNKMCGSYCSGSDHFCRSCICCRDFKKS